MKLCDFGSAKILYNEEEYSLILSGGINSCPKTLTYIGTTHIIPPEMSIISKQTNPLDITHGYGLSVDWWAVGVLFMEMIYDTIPTTDQLNVLSSLPIENIYDSSSDNSSLNFWTICGHSREELESQCREEISEILLVEDILQKFLSITISTRWCIWSQEEIFQHPFFRDINWNTIREGKCTPIPIDKRLGYLELVEEDEKASDIISSEDQALFDGF